MTSGLDHNSVIEQHRNISSQLILRLGVGDSHPGAASLQEQGRRHPGPSQAHNQHAFVSKIHEALLATGYWLLAFQHLASGH